MISSRALRASAFAISTSCFSATIRLRTFVSGSALRPDLFHHGRGLGAHRRIVEQPASLLLVPEKDVLRDAQVVGEVELLVDQHDAFGLGLARTREAHRLAVDAHLAIRRRFVARKDLHQRRLAGAVFAEQAVDAPGFEREADAVQHLHRPEGLVDLVERHGNACRPPRRLQRLRPMAPPPMRLGEWLMLTPRASSGSPASPARPRR